MKKKIVIRLDIEVENEDDMDEIIYDYLEDLMEDRDLAYEVEE